MPPAPLSRTEQKATPTQRDQESGPPMPLTALAALAKILLFAQAEK